MTAFTLREQWERFKTIIVSEKASATEITEREKTFYAGAWSAISIMVEISEEEVSEEAGVMIFELIKTECENFFGSLIEEERRQREKNHDN